VLILLLLLIDIITTFIVNSFGEEAYVLHAVELI